jgi:hypothetical protein
MGCVAAIIMSGGRSTGGRNAAIMRIHSDHRGRISEIVCVAALIYYVCT